MVDGAPMSASLFDFGLFLFHGGRAALERGSGPVPLPAQARIAPRGAALERRLRRRPGGRSASPRVDPGDRPHRDHPGRLRDGRDPLRAARARRGLNAGRWDYIFSIIKKFRGDPAFVLPDRAQVTMAVPFMRAYTPAPRAHLPPARRACHRRHVRLHPQPARAGGDRQRAGQGARGQGARGGRRLRRHLGRASRPGAGGHGGLRPRARRPTEPEGPPARGRRRERRRAARPAGAPTDGSPRPGCART